MGSSCCKREKASPESDVGARTQLYEELSEYVKQSEKDSIQSLARSTCREPAIEVNHFAANYLTHQYVLDHLRGEYSAEEANYAATVLWLLDQDKIHSKTVLDPTLIRTVGKRIDGPYSALYTTILTRLVLLAPLRAQVKEFFHIRDLVKSIAAAPTIRKHLGSLVLHIFGEDLRKDVHAVHVKGLGAYLDDFESHVKDEFRRILVK